VDDTNGVMERRFRPGPHHSAVCLISGLLSAVMSPDWDCETCMLETVVQFSNLLYVQHVHVRTSTSKLCLRICMYVRECPATRLVRTPCIYLATLATYPPTVTFTTPTVTYAPSMHAHIYIYPLHSKLKFFKIFLST